MLLAPIRSFRVGISHQSDRSIRVCISHQSDRSIGACISHQSERRASFFERCSNFNEVMGDSERAVRKIF